MLYPSINKIRKKVDSRYTLVILAAQRARDLIDGKPMLADCEVARPVSIAAKEIADEQIKHKRESDAMDDARDTVMEKHRQETEG
ncbi:MAG: DNA-directed RNA polymerase subunit omega [Hornefia sp.]|nr:DNA-directed RNA polymerase subunit omega [Hornefia sp.]